MSKVGAVASLVKSISTQGKYGISFLIAIWQFTSHALQPRGPHATIRRSPYSRVPYPSRVAFVVISYRAYSPLQHFGPFPLDR